MVAEFAAKRKLMKYSNLPTNLIFQPILWKTWECSAHRLQTLSWLLVIKPAVCLAKKEKLHSCSSICLWHCNDSVQFFCTTSSCSRTIRTNSHTSTVFIAFNPCELYTQESNLRCGQSCSHQMKRRQSCLVFINQVKEVRFKARFKCDSLVSLCSTKS